MEVVSLHPYLQHKSLSLLFSIISRHYCDLVMVAIHFLKARSITFTGKSFSFCKFAIKHTSSWFKKNKLVIFLHDNHCKVQCGNQPLWVTKGQSTYCKSLHSIRFQSIRFQRVGVDKMVEEEVPSTSLFKQQRIKDTLTFHAYTFTGILKGKEQHNYSKQYWWGSNNVQ